MSDASLTCPACGESAPEDSKFCKECGGRLGAAPCGGCGETLEPGSKFCRHCGASAAPAAAPAAAPIPQRVASSPAPAVADDPDDGAVVERAARPAPPPAESKTAIYLGVGVAALGFVWLTVNQQGTPPPPPVVAAPPAGPPAPPGGGGAPTAPAPAPGAAASGPPITGTITVHDSLQGQTPAGGHFFVIARPAGSTSPMPLAVVRLPASASPTPYSLGPENVMGGGPFAGPMDLSVRWDQDGSAGKQPGDLTGVAAQPVSPGTTGVDVVLTQKL